MENESLIQPFVKWAGGKRQVMKQLDDILPDPDEIPAYCEPFVGGGAMLFRLLPKRAWINDINEELINVYRVVQSDVEGLIKLLEQHKNEEEYFYQIRNLDRDPEAFGKLTDLERASRTLYLNRTCYNGLYRVNSSGQFNTPFGRYKNPNIVNAQVLRAVSQYFNRAEITISCKEYAEVLGEIPEDAFVYLDPPYDPVSETAYFTSYAKDGFDRLQQERLRKCCDILNNRGIRFMLSNSATDFIKDQYKNYYLTPIQAKRNINSVADKRGNVKEVVVTNYTGSQNDQKWDILFERHSILEEIAEKGKYEITAAAIRVEREPRLMAKFDSTPSLPRLFKWNHLSILPITRGSYVIAPMKAYHTLEKREPALRKISLPDGIESISPDDITSEAAAINCAYACGIFHDFLGEKELFPTVSGRMGSGDFAFAIDTEKKGAPLEMQVRGAQMEVDAGFECGDSLVLIEAKRQMPGDFLIRQLYYPYRAWSQRVQKRVRPVFFVYSGGIFSLYEYEFQNPDYYNSIKLVRQKNYTLEEIYPTRDQFLRMWQETAPTLEPTGVPFPQADDFGKVVSLCELLSVQDMTGEEITRAYDFAHRQTGYYTSAGIYLDLMEKHTVGGAPVYSLTPLGTQLMKQPYRQRQLDFCRQMLSRPVFHAVFARALESGKVPERDKVVEQMKQVGVHNVGSEDTYRRRAATVRAWTQWALDLYGNATE